MPETLKGNIDIKLSAAEKKVLLDLDDSIKSAQKAIVGLKAAGLDVTAIESELEASIIKRDALLEHFG